MTLRWRVLFAVLLPAAAAATPNFPPAIRERFSLDEDPKCAVCHRGTPRLETATTPFAVAMGERGLRPYNVASLQDALDAMAADGIDSDGDGTPDTDELAAGDNPNGDPPGPPEPFTGCGSRGEVIALLPLLFEIRRRAPAGGRRR